MRRSESCSAAYSDTAGKRGPPTTECTPDVPDATQQSLGIDDGGRRMSVWHMVVDVAIGLGLIVYFIDRAFGRALEGDDE